MSLNLEIQINRRSSPHVEDYVEMPTLADASLCFCFSDHHHRQNRSHGTKVCVLEYEISIEKSCKTRCGGDGKRSIRALRELNYKRKRFKVAEKDVLSVNSDEEKRGKRPLEIVREIYPGRDGVLCSVQLQTRKEHLDAVTESLHLQRSR